jgi:hypothetical protein
MNEQEKELLEFLKETTSNITGNDKESKEVLIIAFSIIKANYPIYCEKYANGKKWRL